MIQFKQLSIFKYLMSQRYRPIPGRAFDQIKSIQAHKQSKQLQHQRTQLESDKPSPQQILYTMLKVQHNATTQVEPPSEPRRQKRVRVGPSSVTFPLSQQWELDADKWHSDILDSAQQLMAKVENDGKDIQVGGFERYYLDRISLAGCTRVATPEKVSLQLNKKRFLNPNFQLEKGYLEKLGVIYYIIGKTVFFYRVEDSLQLRLVAEIEMEENAKFVIYGNLSSNTLPVHQVLLISQPKSFLLFRIKDNFKTFEIIDLQMRIEVRDNVQDIKLTSSGQLFYIDGKGDLYSVQDQSRSCRGSERLLSKPSDDYFIKTAIKNFSQRVTTIAMPLISKISNRLAESFTQVADACQLVLAERSSEIFTLVVWQKSAVRYCEINYYSYKSQTTLIKTWKEEDIIKHMFKKDMLMEMEKEEVVEYPKYELKKEPETKEKQQQKSKVDSYFSQILTKQKLKMRKRPQLDQFDLKRLVYGTKETNESDMDMEMERFQDMSQEELNAAFERSLEGSLEESLNRVQLGDQESDGRSQLRNSEERDELESVREQRSQREDASERRLGQGTRLVFEREEKQEERIVETEPIEYFNEAEILRDNEDQSQHGQNFFNNNEPIRLVQVSKPLPLPQPKLQPSRSTHSIIKITSVTPHLSSLANIEIQLLCGIRILAWFTKKDIKVIDIIYPPDFQLHEDLQKESFVQKEPICPYDANYRPMIRVVASFNKKDRYGCVYKNKLSGEFESYLEHQGYRENPTALKIPTEIASQSSVQFHQIDFRSIFDPSLSEFYERDESSQLGTLFELTEQLHHEPTVHALLSDESVEFSVRLRPIDIIFTVFHCFPMAQCKIIFDIMKRKEFTPGELMVMMIAIACNQDAVYHVSQKVEWKLRNELGKIGSRDEGKEQAEERMWREQAILKQPDIIKCILSTEPIRLRSSSAVGWMVGEFVQSKTLIIGIYEKEIEKQDRKETEDDMLMMCCHSYTARILQAFHRQPVYKITEEIRCTLIARLNQIHFFLIKNMSYLNAEARALKCYLVRAKQLLSLLPLISNQKQPSIDERSTLTALLLEPSRYFQKAIFAACEDFERKDRRLDRLIAWKNYRMLMTKDLMAMLEIANFIKIGSSRRDIEKHIEKLDEIPPFFAKFLEQKEFSVDVKREVQWSSKSILQYLHRRIKTLDEQIMTEKAMRSRNEDLPKLQKLIEERKLMRLKQCLADFYFKRDKEVDYYKVKDMTLEQLKVAYAVNCNHACNLVLALNEEKQPLARHRIVVELFIDHEEIPEKEFENRLVNFIKYIEQSYLPLDCLLAQLLHCKIQQSCFLIYRPSCFNIQKELQKALWIFNILLCSTHTFDSIITTSFKFCKETAKVYTENMAEEMNGKMMSLSWCVCYHLVTKRGPRNRDAINKFKSMTNEMVERMERMQGTRLRLDNIRMAFWKLGKELR